MAIRLALQTHHDIDSPQVSYDFDQQRIVIGRNAGADVQLPFRTVSDNHAMIFREGSRHFLVDQGSTNGTELNGERLVANRAKPLRTNDVIRLGDFAFCVTSDITVGGTTTGERTLAIARKLVMAALDEQGTVHVSPRLFPLVEGGIGAPILLDSAHMRLVFGRGESCDVSISDADMSREHAELVRDADEVVIRDLDSKNGIYINGKRMPVRRLRDRDEIMIGSSVFAFDDPIEAHMRSGHLDAPQYVLKTQTEADTPAPSALTEKASGFVEASTEKQASQQHAMADVVVYGVALAVLIASGLALAWLLGN